MPTLNAKLRTITGRKVKSLRKQGLIPAVIYGHKIKSRNLVVESLAFQKIYQEVGKGIIELAVDPVRNNGKKNSQEKSTKISNGVDPVRNNGKKNSQGKSTKISNGVDKEKPISVLIQAVEIDPLTDRIIHVDFHQVKATEKVTTEIELKFINESKAVKELSGVLVKNLDKIKVEALPKDLIHEIEVDLSNLATFDDIIYVSDLKIPETIKILERPDEVVALVQPPRAEEIIEGKPEERIEEIERVGEKKKEEVEEEEEKKEGRAKL